VGDRTKLAGFRAKRDEWLDWLEGDEMHAISGQITNMLWSDAIFRLINTTRKFASDARGSFATLNGDLASFIDRGYVLEQLVSLRRLMERQATDPKKQVISLQRLIDDVGRNQYLLTREVFVCYDGLPYDYEPVKSKAMASLAAAGVRWGETSGPNAWHTSEREHEHFDGLSNVLPASRSRNDLIDPGVIQAIENSLSAAPLDQTRRILNKTIAHAADETSRGEAAIPGTTLGDIWACHEVIVKAAHNISTIFVRASGLGGVPHPQHDILENFDMPFAPGPDFEEIRREEAENERREDWLRHSDQSLRGRLT
jgi:hypothetical protein